MHLKSPLIFTVSLILLATSGYAATLSPVALAAGSYNEDIVFENDGSPAVSSEFGSRHFIEEGFTSASTPAAPANFVGLRSDRTYTGPIGGDSVTFLLGPYNGNNVRSILGGASNTGLITLAVSTAYDQIGIAFSVGNAAAGNPLVTQVTVNYAGGTTAVFSMPQFDWGIAGTAANPEILNVTRDNGADATFDGYDGNNTWSVFGQVLDVDATKAIDSVSFGVSGGNASTKLSVFALSGSPVPEPGTALLGALTGLALLRRRR